MNIETYTRGNAREWGRLHGWIFSLLASKEGAVIAILLGGDRWACCEYAVVAEQDGEIVGIATMAPEGEMQSGEPTIVGLYVQPEFRRLGIGTKLLELAIRELDNLGLSPIRVDVMSTGAKKSIAKLTVRERKVLVLNDCGGVLDGFLAR